MYFILLFSSIYLDLDIVILDPCQYSEERDIIVTSPSANEGWAMGRSYNITWKSFGNISRVQINLYRVRQHVITIVYKTANNGSYLWQIPTNLKHGENYIIQVKDVDSNVYGLSERFIIYSEKELYQFFTIFVILFISIPSSIVLLYYLIRLRRKKKKLDGS